MIEKLELEVYLGKSGNENLVVSVAELSRQWLEGLITDDECFNKCINVLCEFLIVDVMLTTQDKKGRALCSGMILRR